MKRLRYWGIRFTIIALAILAMAPKRYGSP